MYLFGETSILSNIVHIFLMFKKVEIWLLYLILLMGFPITIGFGVLVRQEIEGKTKHGAIDISFLTKPAAYIARLPERFITSFPTINQLRINQPWHENRDFFFFG